MRMQSSDLMLTFSFPGGFWLGCHRGSELGVVAVPG